MRIEDRFTVTDACTACGACLRTCHLKCLRIELGGPKPPLTILQEVCDGCGECAEVCPAEAIKPLKEIET
ncbi:4Fe-4S binding protein [Salininema proteolyticum]|uniref:4Fe-4S binding protein n=1 Tax=Salininema proteolyticum TaxID=1607685 RepID=A0ABV8U4M5_9ACTN